MTEALHTPGLRRNRSVSRAVSLLRVLADRPGGASTSQLAHSASLPYPTAARMLVTLAESSLIDRHPDDDRWILGKELVRLARRADPHRDLIRRAGPILERLVATVRETAVLGVVISSSEVEVVSQVDAHQLIGMTDWVGRPFALHASAMGKLLLAEMEEPSLHAYLKDTTLERCTPTTIVDASELRAEVDRVRATGYAETVDELEEGLSGLAVPVRNAQKKLAGSIGVGGPSSRLTADRRQEILSSLLKAASELGAASPAVVT